jgi:hypothetical protein
MFARALLAESLAQANASVPGMDQFEQQQRKRINH